MKKDGAQSAIMKLGYTDKWILYGFLTPEDLERQALELESGEDDNPEHYRFRTFLSILSSRSALSDIEIDHYIEIALEDPDRGMAESALKMLAEWSGLTEKAYIKLLSNRAFEVPHIQRALARGKLLRDLNSSNLSVDDCDLYIAEGGPDVQRILLEIARLSRKQLEHLSSHGKSRAVRNMAAVMLRSKKYRDIQ